ncbi:hypothetical protein Prudu_003272 [Prunus dulcis]|uniref:Uncharacterized protein n=1 Tax=Prunus dulcis TaxID=3755 RepID=A0A4Y1QSP0_PRUDU|nr:hypothetical protein Prudu_003272 [Prunus dulcis]
MRTRFRLSPPP